MTLAYPAVQFTETLASLSRSAGTGSLGGTGSSSQTGMARDWFDRPMMERWEWYNQPEQATVRVATRIGGGAVAAGFAIFLLGTVGKAAWYALMLVLMERGGRPGTSHGSARWADGRELAALRPHPGRADLVVGRVGRQLVAIPEREQYEHLLLVAPTGAGKTSGVILPNLLAEPGTRSLVITDPKRELLRKSTSAVRGRYGDANVWVLDLLDPALSRGYNPLAYVTDAATADLFAQTWVRNTGESKDAFWSNAARTLIGAAALHLVATEEITPPLIALVDLLCGTPAEAVSATLSGSPVPEVRRLARGFLANMAKNERLLGSVFTELPPRFTCLNIPAVRATTGTNEINFARLAETPIALYLALDPQYARTLAPLTACFFLHFFTTLTNIAKDAPSGALPVPVMAYLDEFGTVGHIPEFAGRMATVRSAGMGCLLVVQDLAQLKKAYGAEDADTILSNATTKMCLGRVTHDDAEYFSKLAGTTTVLTANRSSSRAVIVPWADRGNRGSGEAGRALITPDELRTMHDEVFAVAGARHPVRARQRRYYDDPALARLLPDLKGADPLIALLRPTPLPLPDVEETPLPVSFAPNAVGFDAAGDDKPTASDTTDWLHGDEPIPLAAPLSVSALKITRMHEPASVGRGIGVQATAVPERRADDGFAPTPSQVRLLVALAATPGASSANLAASLGVQPSTVRDGLMKLRRNLTVGPDDDLLAVARTRGFLAVSSDAEGAS